MEDNPMVTTISVEIEALRLLHRVVSEAYLPIGLAVIATNSPAF